MMFKQKFVQAIGSRTALNLYFWLMMLLIKLPSVSYVNSYPSWVYYVLVVFLLTHFAVLSYVHNLMLLPNFFFKKKYGLYFLLSFIWLFSVSFEYTFLLNYLSIVYPKLEVVRMSIIMSPITENLSFWGIIGDIQTYFFVMLMWLFIFALLAIYHHNAAKLKRVEKSLLAHKEQELAFLKSQLNPHFLFNTLNNIYGLSLRNDEKTSDVILQLSAVLRYLLYESNVALVQFNTEKEVLFSYIDLELLRLGDATNNQFYIYADRDYSIPPLLWLPVVENVFKHTRLLPNKYIDFKYTIENNQIHIRSSNAHSNSIMAEPKTGGIGLNNLRKRLDLLYPDAYDWKEEFLADKYTIEISIKLGNNEL